MIFTGPLARLTRTLWLLVGVLLVLAALYVSLGREYLPQLAKFRPQIISSLTEITGLDLQIGQLAGSWAGFDPGVALEAVSVPHPAVPDQPGLEVGRLQVELDSYSSLLSLAPLLRKIWVKNVVLHLYQQSDGSWLIAGFPRQGSTRLDFLQQLYQTAQQVEFHDVNVVFHSTANGEWRAGPFTAEMHQGLNMRQVTIHGTGPEAIGSRVTIETTGDMGESNYKLRAFLNFTRFDIAPFVQAWDDKKQLTSLPINGDVWLDWSEGVTSFWLRADTPKLDLGPFFPQRKVRSIADASVRLHGQRDPQGKLHLQLHQLQASIAGEQVELSEVELHQNQDEMDVRVAALNIKPLASALIQSGLLPDAGEELLRQLQLSGSLRGTNIIYPLHPGSTRQPFISTALQDFSIAPWKSAPGAELANAYIEAGPRHGTAYLSQTPLALFFPSIYRAPISLQEISGRVSWQVGDRILVNSSPLQLAANFGTATALLDLDLPVRAGQGAEPNMSLLIGLQNGQASDREQLIPNTLPASLLNWLDASVVSGSLPTAGFIYHGSLAKDGAARRSIQLYLDIKDATLQYHPDWPAIQALDAQLILNDDSVYADVQQGRIYDSLIERGRVQVNPGNDALDLDVQATLAGDAADLKRVFSVKPLQEVLGKAFTGWELSGPYRADFGLAMPLVESPQPLLDIRGDLAGVRMSSDNLKLEFTDIQSKLDYHSVHGLHSDSVHAKLWDKPLTGRLQMQSGQGGRWSELAVGGVFAIRDVQQWLQQPALGLVSGTAQFDAVFTIPLDRTVEAGLNVHSDLQGVAVNAPPPLQKSAAELLGFAANVSFDPAASIVELELDSGVGMRVELASGQPAASTVWLGQPGMERRADPGTVLVSGRIENVVFAEWFDTVKAYQIIEQEMKDSAGPAQDSDLAGPESAAAGGNRIEVRDFTVGQLQAFGQEVNDIDLGISQRDDQTTFHLNHPAVYGDIIWRDSTVPIEVDLDYLNFPLNPPPEKELPAPDASAAALNEALPDLADSGLPVAINNQAELTPEEESAAIVLEEAEKNRYSPADMPWLTINIDQFKLYNAELGHWSLELSPVADGAHISHFNIDIPGAQLRGLDAEQGAQLYWRENAIGGQSTWFQGIVDVDNVGDLLQRFGYERGIESQSGRFLLSLQWPGNPTDMKIQQFTGDVDMQLNKGSFAQTSTGGVGALKFLGVLNFNNLLRRLQLDFSDLFGKGLSYDEVQGILQFDDGQLAFEEPLHVTSPSSDFKLTGKLDLGAETIAARLAVTLPVNDNLPWVAALAGGLPIAAGVYLFGKVFKNQLDKLSSAIYRVDGQWSDPVVTFERIFDLAPDQQPAAPGTAKLPVPEIDPVRAGI